MRKAIGLWFVVLAACATDGVAVEPQLLTFGPYTLAPGDEVVDQCVQLTLHNDDDVYVNTVELTAGAGFHHSNWFFVPEYVFAGDDGTFTCADRDFDQSTAAVLGGVLFAQSTQAPHELQAFPPGVAIKVPPHSKVVASIHLYNPGDTALSLSPSIQITPIPAQDVTTTLAGLSFQNQALALPADAGSRFTVECDLGQRHRDIFGRDPDFNVYYALAHYHTLGTKLTVDAVRPDGTSTELFSTASQVGDVMGGPLDPPFSMSGYTKLRLSCEYFNPRADVVRWGNGDQEMCVFLAFTDSTYTFGGGVIEEQDPLDPMLDGNMMTYTNPCQVFATDQSR
jgi:hypothetical protein